MLNQTLGKVVEMVRNEAKLSSKSSRGVDHRDHIVQIIKRTHEQLYDDYDWEYMLIHKEDAGKILQAGERYYDYPAGLNVERAFDLWHKYGNVWVPLEYGISQHHYSQHDSDTDERADPALAWQVRDEKQFEIWPIPTQSIEEVRFSGHKALNILDGDDARLNMDDILISLMCASEILTDNNQPGAPLKTSLATARLQKMRARHGSKGRVRVGMGGGERSQLGFPRIRAVYNANR